MNRAVPGGRDQETEVWGLIDLIGEPVAGEDAEVDAILSAPELSGALREILIAAFVLARLVDPAAAAAAGVRPAASVLGYAHLLLDPAAGRAFADVVMDGIAAGRTAVTREQLRRADLSYTRLYGEPVPAAA
jgi:hypothetical protein